ncbi:hypothetical protein P278_17270 [Zhouia amylolytica AD3]|uniref:DUF2490 domain-containing protein n=2 Tax=Zhouia amylolytica TaxID=376730 RepID=W2UP96_9FLAO|nr:DUF2490 domain-containing protein [Zhouia amylolytica]ETN96005.1 hypothetical protein P278_17270 [Zhouia amylolytica AD3]MCQ0111293.1 DUF2490 domain-containing protein [Zhouia amylolytica]
MKNRLLVICIFLTTIFVKAQERGEDELGAWYMYFGTYKLSEKFSLHTEAQFRYYEVADNFNQMLLRTGINYHVNDRFMVTAGYGFIETDALYQEFGNEPNASENRIYQQLEIKDNWGKLKLNHRYRLEQRFVHVGGESDFLNRVRYRLQLTYPLTETFFVNVYDEIFLNLQNTVFGQNRLYGAFGAVINNNVSVQLGYLKNHFTNVNFDRLQLGVFINADLSGFGKS